MARCFLVAELRRVYTLSTKKASYLPSELWARWHFLAGKMLNLPCVSPSWTWIHHRPPLTVSRTITLTCRSLRLMVTPQHHYQATPVNRNPSLHSFREDLFSISGCFLTHCWHHYSASAQSNSFYCFPGNPSTPNGDTHTYTLVSIVTAAQDFPSI